MNEQTETAILAGGCFWGVEDLIRDIPGVIKTRVGYTGGQVPNPKYELVKTGTTGHAESIKIIFNPSLVSFSQLLDFFFKMHDPTTVNRQGNDRGNQYRSAIFYTNDQQRITAEQKIKDWNEAHRWPAPIATEVTAASTFTDAEEYHQDYLIKNPGGYTCHYYREL